MSGLIAICAMILPGISGSFLLLLLGQYEYMLNALKTMSCLLYTSKSVDVCCVHPILVNGATMRIYAAGSNILISTNSLSADLSLIHIYMCIRDRC